MRILSLRILLISVFILSLNACKKDNTSPKDFRLTKSVITQFYPSSNIFEWNMTYVDNHIKSVVFNNIAKTNYTYSGDSIIIDRYWFENNNWGYTQTDVYKFESNQITTKYSIDSLKNRQGETFYSYDGAKILDILGYKIDGDSTYLYESNLYKYESDKLIQGSFSYKAFPGQDIIENIRRELTYKDGNLYEEFIYRDFNGYPIQLTNKKIYTYDNNNKIIIVKHYECDNNSFVQTITENREYDNSGNLLKRTEINMFGEIVSEQTYTYEVGQYSYQYLYDIQSGSEQKIPLP